jgi:hypothetical protein
MTLRYLDWAFLKDFKYKKALLYQTKTLFQLLLHLPKNGEWLSYRIYYPKKYKITDDTYDV